MEDLGKLIEEVSASLHREIVESRVEMNSKFAEVNQKFDRLEAVLRRHSSIIASGTFAIAGLNKWVGTSDIRDAKIEAELKDLRARVRKLESAVKPKRRKGAA